MLDTPAGWVEYRKKIPYSESYAWDRCDFLQHGKPIPKIFTDVDTPGGADVNAGLMVVSPNKAEYEQMIAEITSPLKDWMGPEKYHKGFYDFSFEDPIGSKFVANSYCYPEQNYLTKRYSGKWTFIEFAFQSWTLDPCNSFGIHMAAFNPKPWFKQPAGAEVKLTEKPKPYVNAKVLGDEDLYAQVEIPRALAVFDESKNYENISVSYELFNDLIIWGFVKYPDLHTYFMEATQVHGSKTSFDKDIFKPLNDKDKFLLFKDIKKGDSVYKRLSISQKYICNLINDYDNFVKKVKDKYLSICKTKMKDRYGNYAVDFTMIDYPGVKDIYETEQEILLKDKLMPFGKFKGEPIEDMDEDYIKKFMKYKGFRNQVVVEVFKESKFSHLLEGNYLSSNMVSRTKSKSASRSKGKSTSKSTAGSKGSKGAKRANQTMRKRTIRKGKGKAKLMYFYMENCSWCNKFNPTWKKLVKEFKGKIAMKKINGPTNPTISEKYDVSSYPTLILVKGNEVDVYEGDRSMKDLKKFLK